MLQVTAAMVVVGKSYFNRTKGSFSREPPFLRLRLVSYITPNQSIPLDSLSAPFAFPSCKFRFEVVVCPLRWHLLQPLWSLGSLLKNGQPPEGVRFQAQVDWASGVVAKGQFECQGQRVMF